MSCHKGRISHTHVSPPGEYKACVGNIITHNVIFCTAFLPFGRLEFRAYVKILTAFITEHSHQQRKIPGICSAAQISNRKYQTPYTEMGPVFK